MKSSACAATWRQICPPHPRIASCSTDARPAPAPTGQTRSAATRLSSTASCTSFRSWVIPSPTGSHCSSATALCLDSRPILKRGCVAVLSMKRRGRSRVSCLMDGRPRCRSLSGLLEGRTVVGGLCSQGCPRVNRGRSFNPSCSLLQGVKGQRTWTVLESCFSCQFIP